MKYQKSLRKAWIQYQDLYDRYMRLLRRLGEGDVSDIYRDYEEQIEFALYKWSPPEDRYEIGELFEDEDDG